MKGLLLPGDRAEGQRHLMIPFCHQLGRARVQDLITPLMSILHSLFVLEGGCKSSADAAAPRR
jgi:hypothetical protein